MAIFVSRTENWASAEHSRMSHAVMRSTPPPMHQPWTAAITGLGQSATAVIAPLQPVGLLVEPERRRRADDAPSESPPPATAPPMVFRSSPTVKCGPLAAMTMARTSSSSASSSISTGRSPPEVRSHGVAPFRAVEPQRGDMAVALDREHR